MQQEILLMTDTTFSQRQLFEKDASHDNKYFTKAEHLEDACWNGLLDELLPEIVEKSSSGKKLHVLQIKHAKYFLEIELCESPQSIEQEFSIDPYAFLLVTFYS